MKKESMNEEIPIQAREDDPRVTKVGKLLRVTAMDELPQLLNIWKGDMSFVGPRALLHDEIEVSDEFQAPEKIPGYNKRISIRPGLTGVAQIYTSRDVSREEKFRYDNFYIDNRNFLLDIKLIIFSFIISFKRNWESRGKKV
jgi:lipopolysaccharide/colanic/teichoic acid biosynthesis glycosyltransferase